MKNSKNQISGGKGCSPVKSTGISVPLGALYTKKTPVIGEFTALAGFAKFAAKAGLKIIQLLPVNDTGAHSSPYSGLSAFALHPIYINLKALPEFDALYDSDAEFAASYKKMIKDFPYAGSGRYNYEGILSAKTNLLKKLYETTETARLSRPDDALSLWIEKNPWIVNYAVYKKLKDKYRQASWKEWAAEDQHVSATDIARRWNDAAAKKAHLFYAWTQMRAAEQFKASADAVKKAKIILKGDMPILMNEDSCDAWALPDIFNHNLRAGSPADGENPTGQNWGFPTYNWDELKKRNYDWWIDRLKSAEQYYGAYRLDHILGFFRIWAIPARDSTALLGHTVPNVPITAEQLHGVGFDDGRIRWLSEPHVHTGLIEDITWNHENAHAILGLFMERIENEELWLFKESVKGDKDIYEADLSAFCTEDAARRIKDVLSQKWRDRALIRLDGGAFVPVWTYYRSTAWESLNDDEKGRLKHLMEQAERDQDGLWERQSDEILSVLTGAVTMVPCGEDLGADLFCLPSVMAKNGILALRVLRWCRRWKEAGQPFIALDQLPPLSVATTSVHDSPTVRQWWDGERDASSLFARTNAWAFGNGAGDAEHIASAPFSEEAAEGVLKTAAASASVWCIHPLQDYLAMEKKYWLSDANDERVNIPGSVSEFNWTYRMPATVEEIAKDDRLIEKIKNITSLHDGGNQ